MQTQQTETIVVSRVLNAPVSKVYQAWTDPAVMAKWFRPNARWVKSEPNVELKKDGVYQVKITHLDGDVYTMGGRLVEAVEGEKVAFIWVNQQEDGTALESLVTVTLKALGDQTELTLTHSQLNSASEREGFAQGWDGCLNMLSGYFTA